MWYRGGIGQLSWVIHRISGVGVLIFLCLHILDTALIALGPEHYDKIVAFYRIPLFRLMELVLAACVLYHALNGARVILMDFWVGLMKFQRQLFYIQMACFALIMIFVSFIMLRPLLIR